jgi:hypothetical protein
MKPIPDDVEVAKSVLQLALLLGPALKHPNQPKSLPAPALQVCHASPGVIRLPYLHRANLAGTDHIDGHQTDALSLVAKKSFGWSATGGFNRFAASMISGMRAYGTCPLSTQSQTVLCLVPSSLASFVWPPKRATIGSMGFGLPVMSVIIYRRYRFCVNRFIR